MARSTEQTGKPLPQSVFHILLALQDGEQHGYAIMRRIAEITDGAVYMGPGTLYGSIKRMLAEGLIEETEERPDPALDDERRRYYRATADGDRARVSEVARIEALIRYARGRRSGVRQTPRLGRA
jgi:DNA-binding PadR family transcriptional regulator